MCRLIHRLALHPLLNHYQSTHLGFFLKIAQSKSSRFDHHLTASLAHPLLAAA